METGSNGAMSSREVEVLAKGERRRFTAEYKLEVLREAENCKQSGESGALLRRDGVYWSNLTNWRKQRERGELSGLTAKRRGPERRAENQIAERVGAMEREDRRPSR